MAYGFFAEDSGRSFQLVRYMPPLADSVLAIHLIGAGGTQFWIELTQGITNPSLLRQYVIPSVDPQNIIYDDSTFDAVLVSLGCMGIIYALVLQVRDQYGLIETTAPTTWQRFKQIAVALYFNDPANRFLEVVLDPYADNNGQNLCLVITRQEGDVTGMAACSTGPVKQTVTDMVHDDMLPINRFEAKHVGGILQSPDGDDVTRMVLATNYILEQASDLRPVLSQDNGKIMQAVYPPTTCGGVSYSVMDIEDRGGPSSTSVYSIEMFFPALDAGGNLAFTNFVDALVSTINERTDTFLVGWVAMRFTGATRASLGMQQWGQTCAAEISTGAGVDGLLGLLSYILELMYQYGGIPHWGQLIDLNGLPGHGSIYPRFQEWRDVYGRMSNNFTVRTFENDLSSRWQLTSPPPVVMPVKIPNLQGQDLPTAQKLAREVGLVLQVTFVTTRNDIDWNIVISQRPLAGVPVPPGTAINVVVGRQPKGPPP